MHDCPQRRAESARIVEFSDFDCIFIEAVEQARIDAHLAEIFPKRLPVCAAAADRTMMNADHAIAPDIGSRFTADADLLWREISDAPREPATERAITICNPRRLARHLYPDIAAVTAPVDHHGALLLRPAHLRNGCTDTGQPRTR